APEEVVHFPDHDDVRAAGFAQTLLENRCARSALVNEKNAQGRLGHGPCTGATRMPRRTRHILLRGSRPAAARCTKFVQRAHQSSALTLRSARDRYVKRFAPGGQAEISSYPRPRNCRRQNPLPNGSTSVAMRPQVSLRTAPS